MAEWKCARCSAQNAPESPSCYFCGTQRDPATPAGRARQPGAPAPDTQATFAIGPGGVAGGLAGGLLAAVVGTVAWYLVVALSGYQIGFVAVAVGWLIGTAVVFGARGRVSWPLVGGAVVMTLAALAVSEYLIVYHLVSEILRADGFAGLDLVQPIELMVDLVVTSVSEDPATLLFWGIALFVAGSIPFRELRPPLQPQPAPAIP